MNNKKIASELWKVARALLSAKLKTRTKTKDPKEEAIAAALAGSHIEAQTYVSRVPHEQKTREFMTQVHDAAAKGYKTFGKNLKDAMHKAEHGNKYELYADWMRGLVTVTSDEPWDNTDKAEALIKQVDGVENVNFLNVKFSPTSSSKKIE